MKNEDLVYPDPDAVKEQQGIYRRIQEARARALNSLAAELRPDDLRETKPDRRFKQPQIRSR